MLTQKKIDTVPSKKKYHDGGGLYFFKSSPHKGRWSFRYTRYGRAQEMGLGVYPAITLSTARQRRDHMRTLLSKDINPLEERRNKRQQYLREQGLRFSDVAKQCYEERKLSWKNKKHRKQWIQTLCTDAYPILDKKPLGELTTNDFYEILTYDILSFIYFRWLE